MQSQCPHCQKHFEKKEIANHTKWCDHNPNRGKSKFLTYVTCPECGKETTKQSLPMHLQMHINQKTPRCKCLHCGKDIYERRKKFCNSSCSATFNNNIRDYSKVKTGPAKGTYTIFGPPKSLFTQRQARLRKYTNICFECKKTFTYTKVSIYRHHIF